MDREVVLKSVSGVITDIKVFRSEHYAGVYLISLLKELGAECPNEWDSWDDFCTISDRYITQLLVQMRTFNDLNIGVELNWLNAEYVQ